MSGTEAQTQRVKLSVEDGLASVHLDHPPGNRITLDMMRRFTTVIDEIRADESVRAVWLWAAGDRFSEGADMLDEDLIRQVSASEETRREVAEIGQRAIESWAAIEIPTVVSALGYIVGAGAGLFTASDFRFSAPGSRLSFPEVDRGMHLAWGIIPKLVLEFGMPIARHLALCGFSVRVEELPPMSVYLTGAESANEEAMRFARALARKPRAATRTIKQTLNDVGLITQGAGSEDSARFAHTVGHPDFMKAIQAWFSRHDA